MHPGLAWAERTAAGRAWVARLPQLVEHCAAAWSLELGEPFPYAYASLALPARDADGRDAVLKLQFPDRESEHEAAALERWRGDGAVRLYAHDATRCALLVERCRPGTPLRDAGAEAVLEVLAALLPRLWVPASTPFRPLTDEAAHWAVTLPRTWERAGRPFERELIDAALRALEELAPTQGELVLVNQDLHADNVLAAGRERWLVIDPKPLAGEREFGLAPIVRAHELGHSERDVVRRLDELSARLGLDRERARRWALAQTLAWAFENDNALPRHVETARWLAHA